MTRSLITSFALVIGMLAFVGQARAVTYEITAPCSSEAAAKGSYDMPTAPMSIGQVTLLILADESIPYIGSARGFNSILQTPVGERAVEIISDSETRTYGWCYEVNGRVPDELASQFLLRGPEHIRWFYGVATSKDGAWVSFCEPTTRATPRRSCR